MSLQNLRAESFLGFTSINAGEISISSADDTVHSNGNIAISDGNIVIYAGDDAIHAAEAIEMTSLIYGPGMGGFGGGQPGGMGPGRRMR